MKISHSQKLSCIADVIMFVNLHSKEHPHIENPINDTYIGYYEEDCTEAEFHMHVLHSLSEEMESESRLEEVNALEYSLACIKTLDDMKLLNEKENKQ